MTDKVVTMPSAVEMFGTHEEPASNETTEVQHTSDRKRDSQATMIVQMALESGIELWHTPAGDPYLSVPMFSSMAHYPTASRGATDFLIRIFYEQTGRAPSSQAMTDARRVLSAEATIHGPEHEVYVRVANLVDRIYVDLCDSRWRVVEITSEGWRVRHDSPVRFRRASGMLPLPAPERGGSLADLRRFVNVASDEDFVLMVCWEVAALRGRGPYPVLIMMAEQGAAKTTTARVLRRLCDPNDSDVRRPARNTEDLMIAASNGHVVAFDNLSRLTEELSDNISVLSTGGGFAVRTLYTNAEETIFNATKPIILNGISQVATRGDLLDRALVLTLPAIPEHRRKDEATFWADFEAARPRLLGALFDAVICALRRLPSTSLATKPRMADFALWGVASEAACPWPAGTFLRAYQGNRQGAVEVVLDGDPVADVVQIIAPWTGTAKDLKEEITRRTPESTTKRKDWFSQPRQVADALRRLAPALRKVGIDVTFTRHGHTRARLIEIERISASASSASSSSPDLQAPGADAGADAGPGSSAGSSADQPNVSGGPDAADAADDVRPLLSNEDTHAADYFGA